MEIMNRLGWIEVITGPMFAGKSEELIRRLKRLDYAKKSTIVFKPLIDNRYGDSHVVSHSKLSRKSINIDNSSDILKYINDKTYAIAIDEVQFLKPDIVPIIQALANRGIRIILSGLDNDFRGEPFPVMATLLAQAEFVTKLTAICVVCGAPATRTQRIIDGKPANYNDPIIKLGADESYESRCRHCHEVNKNEH
jgi:thymidine kinase